ncbi:probable LRR receptor-like serine/threonine-protein kinase At1g06840 isoform X2 [Miscanthus floridulus]|uniref:probable LRR receptor-like serine/threonine-protein kinase At1g06840 isoform X2 n=1 Tax=Miscanthus floridulus TaxID=154761 RepID=UPI003458081F
MGQKMLRPQVLFLCSIILTLSFTLLQPTTAQVTAPWEVDALKAIRGSLIDPHGNLSSWNRGDPCMGNWSHVICYNATSSDGYYHVQELQLLRLNLSGTLAPELGQLSQMKIMDFMWNSIGGTIPKEVGNITSLELLLLNGNQLNGSLPEEIGFLPNLNRIQIDQNYISGPIPKSFANLNKTKHFHMNNNSLSGQIPPELSRLPSLVHLLLDNNNLSGYIPPELSKLPKVLIIQLDNNNFSGSIIPSSYGNISTLLKLSLRNCSLEGSVPDVSGIPQLGYLDLSWNQLRGAIPASQFASNITTIDLSHNYLNGSIPGIFSGLPNLQRLSLDYNNLTGSVPSNIWQNIDLSGNRSLILDFQNNSLNNLSTPLSPPANVTILLHGNPVCAAQNQLNISQYCQSATVVVPEPGGSADNSTLCQPCDLPFERIPLSPIPCICAVPVYVDYRLKSPGFWNFIPYESQFQQYLSSGLSLSLYQLEVSTFMWEEGPRLRMDLKLFPNNTPYFNANEVLRLNGMFTGWQIPDSDIFGPYELLSFNRGWYNAILPQGGKSGLSTGAIVGVVMAAFAAAAILSSLATIIILRRRSRHSSSKKRSVDAAKRISMKITGVKDFTFDELSHCTHDFNDSTLIGQGGYGKVYRGVLADGTVVAIKRAQQGSLQGSKEFFTEIELLSRLHHRNLVSLLGYCDEEDEQMLVYEYMPNGNLRDHLSARAKVPLDFPMRLRIALGSSRGILYLHTEADPPIYHRDIKASNILLDSKFVAKVADFGLSRLAPLPETEGSAPGHVSTVVKGTPGYLDPEYFLTHKLTDKSDVYSLGVVFLELLTGMQPISHGRNIVREVLAANQSGMIFSVVDNRMGSYPAECVEKFAALALRCCQDETDSRPSMVEVVRELETIWRMTPGTENIASSESGVLGMGSSSSNTTSTPTASGSRMASSDDHYISSMEVSGSNLLSSVMPSINPR